MSTAKPPPVTGKFTCPKCGSFCGLIRGSQLPMPVNCSDFTCPANAILEAAHPGRPLGMAGRSAAGGLTPRQSAKLGRTLS